MASEVLPETMRAARVLKAGEPYVIQQVPVPTSLGPHDILIRVKAAGHCHTDTIVQQGGTYDVFPITGSHEPVGVAVKLGDKVESLGKFKLGDKIGALNIRNTCGKCFDCLQDDGRYCDNPEGLIGLTVDGGFADYCILDSRYAALIPGNMDWDQAAPMMCAGTTSYKAILTAGLKEGAVLGISGLGALGHIATQMARAMGYIVVGIDARPEPIELVQTFEHICHLTINASNTSAAQAVKQITSLRPDRGYEGLDAVLVFTDAQAAFPYAIDLLARHGTFVLAGTPSAGLHLGWQDLVFKDIRVLGTKIGEGRDAQATVDLVAKHNIRVQTQRYSLDEVNKVVEDAHSTNKSGKAVVLL
ncbi:hypothetical protein OIO90_000078 [Microbotryomycetes sp. JL221]|nr:hypothetical protein OIO90_000078 [Microbotryomycetes sp. JL221]